MFKDSLNYSWTLKDNTIFGPVYLIFYCIFYTSVCGFYNIIKDKVRLLKVNLTLLYICPCALRLGLKMIPKNGSKLPQWFEIKTITGIVWAMSWYNMFLTLCDNCCSGQKQKKNVSPYPNDPLKMPRSKHLSFFFFLLNLCFAVRGVFCTTGQSLYNAMFGIHRTGPCYKWAVL